MGGKKRMPSDDALSCDHLTMIIKSAREEKLGACCKAAGG